MLNGICGIGIGGISFHQFEMWWVCYFFLTFFARCIGRRIRNYGIAEEYALTNPEIESIHRFFDTSPISPSSKYLAVTQLPSSSNSKSVANISIIKVENKETMSIDQTLAWSSQLGAQLQWGGSDEQLYYNTLNYNSSTSFYELKGVLYDIMGKQKKSLPCPVYHVNEDGTMTVSPDLLQISKTQSGYGVDWSDLVLTSLYSNGIMVNDVLLGSCRLLYTFEEIAVAVGIDPKKTPTYGFHTKWSSNSKFILFVLRTIEKGVKESFLKPRPRVRVQHLIVLGVEKKFIRYLFSWASKPFLSPLCSSHLSCNNIIVLKDGNHPNWIPDSLKISMNMEVDPPILSSLSMKNRRKHMATVIIDLQNLLDGTLTKFDLFHQDFHFISPSKKEECLDSNNYLSPVQKAGFINVFVVWRQGSGHPSIDGSGRYLLMDKYTKESNNFDFEGVLRSPILLIDLFCQVQYTLTEVRFQLLLHFNALIILMTLIS